MKEKIIPVGNTVRQEKKKKRIKGSVITAALLALLCTLFVLISLIGSGESDFYSGIGALSSAEEEAGFPVSFSTNDIIDVRAMGKKLTVLTKKFVSIVSHKGEILLSKAITYAEPAIFTNDKYTLVYDRLSEKYMVIDSACKIREGSAYEDGSIFAAMISEKGEVALSVKSSSSASILQLVDKKGEDKLVWSCAEEYITCMDMASDTVFLATMGAYGGEIYTKAYVLALGEPEPVCQHIFQGSSPVSINHISSQKFSLVCDDALYLCNGKKDEVVLAAYPHDSALLFYCCDGSVTATVTQDPDNFTQNLLSVFVGGELDYSIGVDEDIIDISLDNKAALLLYKDRVDIVSSSGKKEQSLSFDAKCTGVLTAAGRVYCYSLGGVERAKE